MTSLGLCSTSDVITSDQNWHQPDSSSAGENDLSIDTQIRVIGVMEPEIWTKMLRYLSDKQQSKISCDYTWLLRSKNARREDAFSEVFLSGSKSSRRSITAAKEKKRERKGEKTLKK